MCARVRVCVRVARMLINMRPTLLTRLEVHIQRCYLQAQCSVTYSRAPEWIHLA